MIVLLESFGVRVGRPDATVFIATREDKAGTYIVELDLVGGEGRRTTSSRTAEPTAQPSTATAEPTSEPTPETWPPSAEPSQAPTHPTAEPSQAPTHPTAEPTGAPTTEPTPPPLAPTRRLLRGWIRRQFAAA